MNTPLVKPDRIAELWSRAAELRRRAKTARSENERQRLKLEARHLEDSAGSLAELVKAGWQARDNHRINAALGRTGGG